MTVLPRHRQAIAATFGYGFLLLLSGCATEFLPPPLEAVTPPCPQWVEFPADRHNGQGSPYLGCVSAFNLRAMVANPRDLEYGRPLGASDGDRETLAIETYRQGKIKPFDAPLTSSTSK